MRTLLLVSLLALAACRNEAPAPAPTADTHGSDHAAMGHGTGGANGADSYTDVRFLDEMIHHHAMAVDMAQIVQQRGADADVKRLAASMMAAQSTEIDSMRAWRQRWFATSPATEMNADAMARMGMTMPMDSLTNAPLVERPFLEGMIPHHAGAIVMASEALTASQRPEIHALARSIVRTQATEIGQMQAWLDRR